MFGGPAGTRTRTTAEFPDESASVDSAESQIPPENPRAQDGIGPTIGPMEAALASALTAAVSAGDLALVARIVGELEARRRDAAGNVAVLAPRAPGARPKARKR